MKKHAAVIAAELVVDEKKLAVKEAKEKLAIAERELAESIAHVRSAQKSADEALPKCKLECRIYYSGNVSSVVDMVILRQTKAGRLVVRGLGNSLDGCEKTFKFCKNSGAFVPVDKQGFSSIVKRLIEVPAKFIPKP